MPRLLCALLCLALALAAPANAAPLVVVAAESIYGDIAAQVAGDGARVTSVLTNPDIDPHMFEISPSVARGVSGAAVVIVNGAGYDAWMDKLLASEPPGQQRVVINAAILGGHGPQANPHVWFDPAVPPAVARAVADALASLDPAGAAGYRTRLDHFTASLAPLARQMGELRSRHAGKPVTATEPLFGYLAAALGLEMRNDRFQLAVMNDTEPRASDVAAFEHDLRERRVRALLYNAQASDASAQRLLAIARASDIPVVGGTETLPSGARYQEWLARLLTDLDNALSQPEP